MERLRSYGSIVIATVIVIIFWLILYYYVPGLISSNFFTGITTFLVGIVAIFLYIRQRIDHKREAASIILMEIRNAERVLDLYRNAIASDLSNIIFPTNNWSKYNYLFIKDLDRDELDLINNFYNECSKIDKSSTELSASEQIQQKTGYIQGALVDFAKSSLTKAEYDDKKKLFIDIVEKEPYVFNAMDPHNTMLRALNNVRNITTTTAGSKLKTIARMD